MNEKINSNRLDDSELEKVSGGFREESDLPTKGKNIICPKCQNDKKLLKTAKYDPMLGSVQYECGCGVKFVCYKDNVIMYDDFLDQIKGKYNYIY